MVLGDKMVTNMRVEEQTAEIIKKCSVTLGKNHRYILWK
jgi:hypothetical protein